MDKFLNFKTMTHINLTVVSALDARNIIGGKNEKEGKSVAYKLGFLIGAIISAVDKVVDNIKNKDKKTDDKK